MIHGCVTLDEVFAAAGVRAASLVPETSGYLALAVGDATSRLPFNIDDRVVMLTTEGNVGITKRGEVLPARQAAGNLRTILARLLAVATGTAMPSLSTAARPREESDRGVDTVIEEIEAALIPVNRSAARRALARLARETIKAKESGRLRRPSARQQAEAARAAAAVKPPAPEAAARAPLAAPPAPVVSAPRRAPAALPQVEHVAASGVTPPPNESRDPTPTELGMAPIEIAEIESLDAPMEGSTSVAARAPSPLRPQAEPMSAMAASPSPTPSPSPTGLPESTVLAQPTEDPALAFDLAGPARSATGSTGKPPETLTPPVLHDVAPPPPRGLPATRPAPEPAVYAPLPAAVCAPARDTRPTRADDLLARFGASCVDDDSMRRAAACLRQMAGVDPTPPPARVEIRLPEPAPAPPRTRAAIPIERDPEETVRLQRSRLPRSGLGLALVALVVGLAGGAAVVHLRPDLLIALTHPAMEPAAAPAEKREATPPTAPPAVPPALTAEPGGATAPAWSERLGGTRAERGSEQRAR
jgi:hypothetical protein